MTTPRNAPTQSAPSVLFVCVKNGGKSQMAAGLMRKAVGDGVIVDSAGIERELIRERTNAGLAAARARGRHGGRPPRLTADQVKTAQRLYDQKELTVGQIGDVLGVSRTTIYRALERQGAQANTAGTKRPGRRKAASATT